VRPKRVGNNVQLMEMDLHPHHRYDSKSSMMPQRDTLFERQRLGHAMSTEPEFNTFIIDVDSSARDRDRFPDTDEYTVYFKNPLINVVRCDLLSAEVPNVAFNVDASNQKFAPEEVVGTNAPYVVAFEIQQGHYDITGLSNEIQRLLNIYTHGIGSPYTVSSITSQNKVIFRAVAPVTRFRLRFDLDDNCSGLLGFGNDATPFNDTVASADPMYAKALLSPAYVDTSGDHVVFLTSPELGTNFHEVSYQKTQMGLLW
jgi:hypothetical protein